MPLLCGCLLLPGFGAGGGGQLQHGGALRNAAETSVGRASRSLKRPQPRLRIYLFNKPLSDGQNLFRRFNAPGLLSCRV
jgi:hypothetical protein